MFQRGMVRVIAWIRLTVLTVTALVVDVGARRRPSSTRRPIRPSARSITSRCRRRGGTPTRRSSSTRESLGIPGDRRGPGRGPRASSRSSCGKLNVVLRPATKHKFRFKYLPIKYEAPTTHQARVRLQRPAVSRRPAGQHRGRLHDLPLRLRVRLRLPQPRVRRRAHRPEVHRRPRGAREPDAAPEFTTAVAPIPTIGFVGRGYVGQELRRHRRGLVLPGARRAGSEDYDGEYTDCDFYGTVNFTEQRRRHGRLSLDRRVLRHRPRHRRAEVHRALLRRRRPLLSLRRGLDSHAEVASADQPTVCYRGLRARHISEIQSAC